MTALLDRHLLVVTGKGGTGKTTVTAGLAVLAARRGKRVLVCEMDAKGTLATAFDAAPLTFTPTQVSRGIHAMAMNTEDALREYMRLFVPVPLIARVGVLAHTLDFVADAAPGVKEILSLGKLCWEVRERHYDLVLVDGVASGHVVAQLGAPEAIGELIQVGPVKGQTRWMRDIIEDPARTGVVVVTTPEEMPVLETADLVERLRRDVTVDIAGVVVNRVLPRLFDDEEATIFEALQTKPMLQQLRALAGRDVTAVIDGARLAVAMWRGAEEHLAELRQRLPAGVPELHVPELFSRSTARRSVEQVAEALAGAIDGSGR